MTVLTVFMRLLEIPEFLSVASHILSDEFTEA